MCGKGAYIVLEGEGAACQAIWHDCNIHVNEKNSVYICVAVTFANHIIHDECVEFCK